MSTLHSHIDPHTHGVVNILPRSMLPLIHELAHSLPIALHCVHCLCTTQNFCLSAPGTLSAGEKKTHIHIDIWDLHIAHRTPYIFCISTSRTLSRIRCFSISTSPLIEIFCIKCTFVQLLLLYYHFTE